LNEAWRRICSESFRVVPFLMEPALSARAARLLKEVVRFSDMSASEVFAVSQETCCRF
jgi:hypothetical protein